MKFILLLFFLFNFSAEHSFLSAQSFPVKNDTLISSGMNFSSAGFHEFLFGANNRGLWNRNLPFKIIDFSKIKSFAGKKFFHYADSSLYITDAGGNEFFFVPFENFNSNLMPGEFGGTFSDKVLSDLKSAFNPVSAPLVSEIYRTAGLKNFSPILAVIPDGQLPENFPERLRGKSGLLYSIKEFGEEVNPNTNSAIRNALADRIKHRFAADFLKGTLINRFLFRMGNIPKIEYWTKEETNNAAEYLPVLTPYPSAFAEYGGLIPTAAKIAFPDFSLKEDTNSKFDTVQRDFNSIEKGILSRLSHAEWDSITSFTEKKISRFSLNKNLGYLFSFLLPEEYSSMMNKISEAGNFISEISEKLFYEINEFPDIYGTAGADSLFISQNKNGEAIIKLFAIDNYSEARLYFKKLFTPEITSEIRIYLLTGRDKTHIENISGYAPLIRVITNGKNSVSFDSSYLRRAPLKNILFYGNGKNSEIISLSPIQLNQDTIKVIKKYDDKHSPAWKDKGDNWSFYPYIDFNTDDGLVLGGGPQYTKYNFRMIPFDYKIISAAAYASRPGSYILFFNGVFNSVFKNSTLELTAFKTKLLFTKFYGYGNGTKFDKELESQNYYKMDQEITRIKPAISFNYFETLSTKFGIIFEESDIKSVRDTLLINFPREEYGKNLFALFGFNLNINIDTRDDNLKPKHGLFADFNFQYYPSWLDNKYRFGDAEYDVRVYLPLAGNRNTVLALRSGGKTLLGGFPFHKAAFLGGSNNLRGYKRERFSGKASVFAQAELRIHLLKSNFIIPGNFGCFIFGETGRVFAEAEISSKWHPSFGAGLSSDIINEYLVFNASIAFSDETVNYYFNTSFRF